ncbi:CueP family metal-binding protein [Oceanobacillus alkalisoli]|uniref:CueP family metal-binding protein n=1 Tax=Oceanobacillus alkalisoli TaxID=2925113 RepID=UPI001EF108D5|nr:CueP family metal-binding protein [Oceanobacillus alkalisoli]MCF3942277.1 CueP family metal-binding protein [Oceanobacillus alkalisoli]MCG5104513.1 CueP family metal-binding protein [Oceanobacillus alkalisoli]
MKKSLIFTIVGIVILGIVVLSFLGNDAGTAPKANETQDIKELVLDYSVGNIENETASISSHELIVTDAEENQLIYDLPEDEFFVSIAPFINQTHPCDIHSLTGCQGEMVNEEFDVYIEDSNGNVIIDQTMKSEANGFIDLWVPREETYQVTITQEGKIAESEFSTFKNDNTCITTMQLM